MQHKTLQFDFNIKATSESDDFFTFEGLASTFSEDLEGDVIMPGAFKESLAKGLPPILFQHLSSEPIGISTEARETKEGLFFAGKLPKSDDLVKGRVIPQMKIGSLKSMSIGFSMCRDDVEIKNGTRFIKKVDLREVSLVTFPANPGAQVMGFKSIEINDLEQIDNKRSLEELLRDSGFSRKAATYLASKVDFATNEDNQKESLMTTALEEAADVNKQINDLIRRIKNV